MRLSLGAARPAGWSEPGRTTREITTGGWRTKRPVWKVVPLYEVEDGVRYRITHWPAGRPVADYLTLQGRYRHLDETAIREIQDDTDRRWEALTGRGS